MISVTLYQTIQEWHAADVEKREIARRLRLDIKTVRRHIRKIDAGAAALSKSAKPQARSGTVLRAFNFSPLFMQRPSKRWPLN